MSLAYSPGVAAPCLEIQKNPDDVFRYTAKGNLVAVISNGTAVLGLGNIGSLASKPVMEGKAVLFKRFADIDAADIEINTEDPDKVVETAALIGDGFGGINLEDIKAPECFYIESELKKRLNIPVFHDDQHGTAVVVAAGLINGLELTGRKSAISNWSSTAPARQRWLVRLCCGKWVLKILSCAIPKALFIKGAKTE